MNGFIDIFDLYNKKIFKVIYINNSNLGQIIPWNNQYILVADNKNKSFKIIDLNNYKVISDIKVENENKNNNNNHIRVKKVNHPKYGESLLTSCYRKLKLWCI